MNIPFTLDGKECSVEREIGDSVLDILRDDCQRTEIKQGCSPQGACGSCMVVINGKPRLSCSLRAKNISGKTLQTLVSLDPKLKHKLEQAFVAWGATGCGYCMPAILHQMATLLHHIPRPTDKQLNKALHMHACPCLGFDSIKKAIQTIIEDAPLPDGNLHPRQRLALWGERSRVADISVPTLLHLVPVFADRFSGKLESIEIPECPERMYVLTAETSSDPIFLSVGESFARVDALCALVLSTDKASAVLFAEKIQCKSSTSMPKSFPQKTERLQTENWAETPNNLHWVEIEQEIPSQDAGYIETEACFVQNSQIIVNGIPIQNLHKRYPSYEIESWAAGGSFGGRTQDSWVDWAVYAEKQLGLPVLLALSMSDSIRCRPKSPAYRIHLSLGYQADGQMQALKGSVEIDGGQKPELCQSLLESFISALQEPYAIPFLNLSVDLVSNSSALLHPLRPQGIQAISTALEGLVQKMRTHLLADPFNIRLQNLRSDLHREILTESQEPYLEALKHLAPEHSLGLACSMFSPKPESDATINLVFEDNDLLMIQGPQPDTGDFLEYSLIEIVHQETGIPLKNIGYEVISSFSSAPSAPFLLQKAVQFACYSLAEALEEHPIEELIGQSFLGTASIDPEEELSVFAVSFAELSSKGLPTQIHTNAQGLPFQNKTLAQSYLKGIQYRSLGTERCTYQDNKLPTSLFSQLHQPKAKVSPTFRIGIRADLLTAIEVPVSASVFAAIQIAKLQF